MVVKSIMEFGRIYKKYTYDVFFDEEFKSEVVSLKRFDEISSGS